MIRFWDMNPVEAMLMSDIDLSAHLDGDLAIHRSKQDIVEGFVKEYLVFTMYDLSGKFDTISSVGGRWVNVETINTKEEMALASYVINWARNNDVPCYLRDNKENQ